LRRPEKDHSQYNPKPI